MPDPGPAHLSIGEVLGLLLEEFPDVTISKIRFLESQGLIEPERTPSGYRKFFEDDVELLRVILREQRENFLPLRVIKDRIDSGQLDPTPPRGQPGRHGSPRRRRGRPGPGDRHPSRRRTIRTGRAGRRGPAGRGGRDPARTGRAVITAGGTTERRVERARRRCCRACSSTGRSCARWPG